MRPYLYDNVFGILLFLFAVSTNIFQPELSFSEIYKWVREDGTLFYSETPPPEAHGVNVTKMGGKTDYSNLVLPDELYKLKYDGTSESLIAIKDATFLDAQEGNIIAIDICRQAMIVTGDEKGLLQIRRYKKKNFSTDVLEQWVTQVARLSESGDVFYKIVLATIYLEGDFGRSDRKKALEIYKEAANEGYPDAYCKLGIAYQNGIIVARDISKAMEYYQMAGKMGSPIGYYNIAALYYHGKYVQKNYAKAADYYYKSASQGYSRAQNDLGLCYYHGHGVPVNKRQAKQWIQKSADQGYYPAEENIYNLDF